MDCWISDILSRKARVQTKAALEMLIRRRLSKTKHRCCISRGRIPQHLKVITATMVSMGPETRLRTKILPRVSHSDEVAD